MAWEGFDLSAENGRELYVPEGFGHGFITLADDTHVTYQVSHPYTPGFEGGLRYDDPSLGIVWPEPVTVISPKDVSWPSFDPERVHARRELTPPAPSNYKSPQPLNDRADMIILDTALAKRASDGIRYASG